MTRTTMQRATTAKTMPGGTTGMLALRAWQPVQHLALALPNSVRGFSR